MAISPVLRGLPPLVDNKTRLLILGSFPSEASLAKQQYYGNPLNQFWEILGNLCGENLAEMDYASRKAAMLRHGIGLWDVFASCSRKGSLDSNIAGSRLNDFEALSKFCPALEGIGFNGKKAGGSEQALKALGFATHILPSSSPAYTLSLMKKCAAWKEALSPILKRL